MQNMKGRFSPPGTVPAPGLRAEFFLIFRRANAILIVFKMKRFFLLSLWVAGVLLADRLGAVVMVPIEIEAMAERAQLIVQGTVLTKTCQRDTAGRIFTKIELQISEVWKGTFSGRQLQIIHGGGTLGEERSMVSGQVEYDPGEEVVGFFVINDRGEAITLGLAQGKFHVWQDQTTGEKLAANLFHGQSQSSGAKAAALEKYSAGERITLTQLKQRVRGASR
jgi:hypothetical protein